MTNTTPKGNIAHTRFVPGTSRGPRSLRTLAQQMAKAERERLEEIGARIKELRGRIPQPVIADRVGVTLRAYQAWEAGGGIAWPNLVKLAEVLGVSEDYIEYGDRSEQEDGETQLDRIEAKLDDLLAQIVGDEGAAGRAAAAIGRGFADPSIADAREAGEAQPGTGRRSGAKPAARQARAQGKRRTA